MSSRPPNNDSVQYPTLPGTSDTSAGNPNGNAVTNSNAQGSVNNASGGNTKDNAGGTSKNAASGSSNSTANQESNQNPATTRQTRSSGRGAKVALESLGPIEELSQKQLREQQHHEIDRIIDDKFDLSIVAPEEIERPKKSHKTFWDTTPFVGSVRRLQIDPSNQKALAFVEKVNGDIEAHNKEKDYSPGRGRFPLKYLQDKYQSTQALRTTYKDTTDPERKKELAAIFKALCVATQEFCEDYGLPETWAWQYADINKEPSWLSEAEEPQSNSATNTGNRGGTESGTGNADGTGNDSGIEPSTGNSGTESGTGNANGPGADSGAGSSAGNGEDTEMSNTGDPSAGTGSANNGDTGIIGAMDKLTLDSEPIKSKRQVFKTFQFLVEEKSGLHVWKSAQLCGDLKPEDIPSVGKPTKEFITQHKHRYKSMRWIAMSVDDAITSGAGQYPRISVMVEWLGDLEDTLLSRSDLIKIADQARVDQDLSNHLPYRKMIEFEGRKVFIMSQTEAGLFNGEMKAMQRIKNDQFKAVKAAQSSQTGIFQPGLAQPGVTQSAFVQPGITQSGVTQPGVAQPGVAQPGVAQPGVAQPGFVQPGVAQPAASQPAVPQAGVTQGGVAQPGVTQPGADQATQADMIPSSAVQAMIASAVQQAIQQYQRQLTPAVAA
ncbi:Glutamine-rich protein 2 [Puttea exsequens]|nr:Glutamine-rich protein 2 [Puttea exsequens]